METSIHAQLEHMVLEHLSLQYLNVLCVLLVHFVQELLKLELLVLVQLDITVLKDLSSEMLIFVPLVLTVLLVLGLIEIVLNALLDQLVLLDQRPL